MTSSEKVSVLVTAQKLGVAEEDITVFSDLDDYYNIEFQLKQSLKQVQNSCRNGKKTLLITYAGGHGYEDGGGQCMLINDTVKACLPLETRLKNLAT